MALLPVAEALTRILDCVEPAAAETVPLMQAAGRVLAADVAAKHNQPPFTASAMDGYAVRGGDVAVLPATLEIIGESAAGRPWAGTLGAGEAVRIFTGAILPEGADGIVIQENTDRVGARVVVRDGTPEAVHIRAEAMDFKAGAVLLRAGRIMTPRAIMLAAAMGHATLPVRAKPRVAILATGDELIPPGSTLRRGEIVSSNPFAVAALVAAAGGEPIDLGIVRDTRADLDRKITEAGDADILVTIGGASVGDHDLVAPALQARGLSLDFWKIAMRPGKPMLFGRRGRQRVLGLPGNPVSCLVCGRVFLVPLVKRLLGSDVEAESHERAVLAHPLDANGPRTHYMRATLARSSDGPLFTTALPSQDSSLIGQLALADCLIVRQAGAPAAAAGEAVSILRLDF